LTGVRRDQPRSEATKKHTRSVLTETETIRRFVRNAETNNMATLDEARQLLKVGEGKKHE
jgi:hypothetical protein